MSCLSQRTCEQRVLHATRPRGAAAARLHQLGGGEGRGVAGGLEQDTRRMPGVSGAGIGLTEP